MSYPVSHVQMTSLLCSEYQVRRTYSLLGNGSEGPDSTPAIAQESRQCPAALRPIQPSHGARRRGGGLPFRAFNI